MDAIKTMNVIKKSGKEVVFDREAIYFAIQKANDTVEKKDQIPVGLVERIAFDVENDCLKYNRAITTDEISDIVEEKLMSYRFFEVAKNYIKYRFKRMLANKANTIDEEIMTLIERDNEVVKQENANKNPTINSVQRDYMAGSVSKDICKRYLIPEDITEAHEEGLIHFHDQDYFAQHMHNCCLVNLEDMLMHETVISNTLITTPHSFRTACNIATQAIAQIASSQYGGQTISLAHLIPFVDMSRKRIRKEVEEEMKFLLLNKEETAPVVEEIVAKRLKEEIKDGVQTIQYQLITLMTTNGQAPFVSVYMNLKDVDGQAREDLAMVIEEVLRQRIKGVQNEKGYWITPAFPKLLYVLNDINTYEGSKYFELTKLAAQCTAKRMVPDYISEKKMKELKQGDVYACMGCRSFLTVDRSMDKGNLAKARNYKEGERKYWGRFNQGVVTLNLVDVACSSYGEEEYFWSILEQRLELCHRALRLRHERLLGTPSDVAPILWQHGALARLEKGEKIDKLLYDGYSTISLGYAGLSECVYYMTHRSHTDEKVGKPFALKVMRKLNDACAKWKKEENIDYSVYGTPIESTTYKFAKCLQRRFGIIPEVTDRNYITNSYHVHVTEKINAFDKLKFEAPFQELSPGGAISYVEVPDMQHNIDAVIAIMQYIYENIMYAELNTKSDFCENCSYDGQMQIVEDAHGKLIWECPNCGNRNQDTMDIARRTCGYIGTVKNGFNQGRTAEIADRVEHVSLDAEMNK